MKLGFTPDNVNAWTPLLSSRSIRKVRRDEEPDDDQSPNPDARTPFERDLGKVIFSTPFRRLQDKAQVFPLEPMDGVRNRASHSAEVSNVAKDLATAVARELVERKHMTEEQARSFVVVAQVCGHAHDFGNPPFGHAGEDAIKMWFNSKSDEFWKGFGISDADKKDFTCFDGNAQTLRLVSSLQVLADLNGLNLTSATFSALMKYNSSANTIGSDKPFCKKLGFFKSEMDLVEKVQCETHTRDRRHPITFLVEAADDIVYAVCDIEDAVKKRVISWNQVKGASLEDTFQKFVKETERFIDNRLNGIKTSTKLLDTDHAYAQYLKTVAIKWAVNAVAKRFIEVYSEIMSGPQTTVWSMKSPGKRLRRWMATFNFASSQTIYAA